MSINKLVLIVVPLLLSIGAIYAFIPIFIIIILIAAAAGLTRGYDLLAVFGIGTLFGFGSQMRKGGLKGFSYGMGSSAMSGPITGYAGNVSKIKSLPLSVPRTAIKGKISQDVFGAASKSGVPAAITSEALAKPHVAKYATKLEALNAKMANVQNKMSNLEHRGMLGYDKNYQNNQTPKPSFAKTVAWMLTPALPFNSIRAIKQHRQHEAKLEAMQSQKINLQNKMLKAADPAKYNQYWAKAKTDLLAERRGKEKKNFEAAKRYIFDLDQAAKRRARAKKIKEKQKKAREAKKFMEQEFVNPRYDKKNEPPPQQ